MKKYLKLFTVILVSILVLTGCGKKTKTGSEPVKKDEFKDAIKNTFDGKNFSLNLTLEEEETAAIDAGSRLFETVKFDYYSNDNKESIHFNAYEKMTRITIAGPDVEEYTEEGYEVYKDGKYYSYSKLSDENKWTYTTGSTAEFDEISTDNVLKIFTSYNKVESDKEGYTKYDVNLDKEIIKEELGSASIKESTAYIKDGKLAIIYIKATTKEDSRTITMTYEISNVGEIKEIVVPDEVLKSAIEE